MHNFFVCHTNIVCFHPKKMSKIKIQISDVLHIFRMFLFSDVSENFRRFRIRTFRFSDILTCIPHWVLLDQLWYWKSYQEQHFEDLSKLNSTLTNKAVLQLTEIPHWQAVPYYTFCFPTLVCHLEEQQPPEVLQTDCGNIQTFISRNYHHSLAHVELIASSKCSQNNTWPYMMRGTSSKIQCWCLFLKFESNKSMVIPIRLEFVSCF